MAKRLRVSNTRRCANCSGQMVPWFLVVLLVAVGVMVLIAQLGAVVHDAAQARTAADAAALAGARFGQASARELAEANGAVLVWFTPTADGAEVLVRVGRMRARARAVRELVWARDSAGR